MSLNGIVTESQSRQTKRHVREILKGLELERANHSAAPCIMERKDEDSARMDGSKGENQRGQRQTQTEHECDGLEQW